VLGIFSIWGKIGPVNQNNWGGRAVMWDVKDARTQEAGFAALDSLTYEHPSKSLSGGRIDCTNTDRAWSMLSNAFLALRAIQLIIEPYITTATGRVCLPRTRSIR
jgi:hypothetical protein